MGKNKDKNKDSEIPNPASVSNRDILQRLNFLYQASVFLNGLAPTPDDDHDDAPRPSTTLNDNDNDNDTEESELSRPKKTSQKKRRRVVSFEELSRSYVDTMKSVGQKTNVRMDPSVKRRLCKRCSAPLIPGVSATVRVQDSTSHGHLISYRCHCCQTERRIPAPPVLRIDPPTDEVMMQVQPTEDSRSSATGSTRPMQRRQKKGGPQRRLPPHFARDMGHVVFRGNERLETTHNIS